MFGWKSSGEKSPAEKREDRDAAYFYFGAGSLTVFVVGLWNSNPVEANYIAMGTGFGGMVASLVAKGVDVQLEKREQRLEAEQQQLANDVRFANRREDYIAHMVIRPPDLE